MKKYFLCAILLTIAITQNKLNAQSPNDRPNMGMQIWRNVQSLTHPDKSEKTTNTVKKLKATSIHSGSGSLIDSFLVLEPSGQGSSKLYFFDFYVYSNWPSYRFLDKLENPYTSQFADFKKAFVYNGHTASDTIERTMNSNGDILTSRIQLYLSNQSSFWFKNTKYTYDNQNRLINAKDTFDKGSGDVTYSNIDFFYAANGDYITITNTGVNGTNNYYGKDSLVLSNGNLMYFYTLDYSGNLLSSHYQYTYNSNQELIKIEWLSDTTLNSRTEIIPHPGSDYPEEYNVYDYFMDTSLALQSFNFNSTTGFIESSDWYAVRNGDTLDYTYILTTDADGDIIQADLRDNVQNYTKDVTNLYYDFPNSVKSISEFEAQVQAYPVPSSGRVDIVSSEPFDGYVLYDQSGRVLQSKDFNGVKRSQVDLESFAKGVYFCKLKSGNKEKTIVLERE